MNGKTPDMKFSDTIVSTTRLSNFHTFGCPVCNLDDCLQIVGGGGPPKWDPRARLVIYLGHYSSYSGGIALVMNPMSGLVSLQFHLVFHDNTKIVPHLQAGIFPENWAELVDSSKEKSIGGFYDVTKT